MWCEGGIGWAKSGRMMGVGGGRTRFFVLGGVMAGDEGEVR